MKHTHDNYYPTTYKVPMSPAEELERFREYVNYRGPSLEEYMVEFSVRGVTSDGKPWKTPAEIVEIWERDQAKLAEFERRAAK